MPLFDFVCEKCEKTEERLIRRDDMENQTCACGEKMVKSDAVSKMSFQLKGVWYKTHKRY